jgi:rRNA maturation endonuclease Nob1
MDFIEIAKAWAISMNPTPQQKEIANTRIEICNSCEHNKCIAVHFCDMCGCPLQKKIYSTGGPEGCPGSKWTV